MKKFFSSLLLTFVALFLGCREDEESITNHSTVSIDGYVQKGPFINGTAITLSELNEKLVTTGKNFTTQIADNKGSFSLKDIPLQSNYVQLQADGFYFDEVKGEKSAAQLTLFALSNMEDASSINANLLSHMERTRVLYLMQEEEKSFIEAKTQAQREILAVFGIVKEDILSSELLDISQNGDDNAILLAISAILQADNSVAELSELVANIITDLREDGVLNSQTNQDKIRAQAKSLDLHQIRTNLRKRYEELGVNATIPNFEQYIDSDGDGLLNKDEDDIPDDFVFEPQLDVAVNTSVESNEITIIGLNNGGASVARIIGGKLIVNGQEISGDFTQLQNGDKVRLKVQSSIDYATSTVTEITISSLMRSFSVTTDDYLPDSLSFTPQNDVAVTTYYISDTITVTGLPHPTPVSIENGKIIKNGQLIETDSISIMEGDQIALQNLSSSKYSATSGTTLRINSYNVTFKTVTDDYVPDTFDFTPLENAKTDSLYTSETITISGLLYPTPIKVINGNILKNGKLLETEAATVISGDQIALQNLSSEEYDAPSVTTLQVNSLSVDFATTTDDYAPDDFSFSPIEEAKTDSAYTSETIIISGLLYEAPISVSLGTLFINGTEVLNTGNLVTNGDEVYLQLSSSLGYSKTTEAELIIGSSAEVFSITTFPGPWVKKADYPGSAMSNQAGFVINGKIYTGIGRSTANDFWEYDPVGDRWIQKADYPGNGRGNTFSFTINGKGYVGGGASFSSEIEIYNDFWQYDPIDDSWTQMSDFPGGTIYSAASFTIDQIAYVGTGSINGTRSSKFWKYDPETDTWTQISDFPGGTRGNALGFTANNKGFIGLGYGTGEYKKDIWQYFPTTDTWQLITTFPGYVEDNPGFTFFLDDHIYIGGLTTSSSKDHGGWWKYNVDKDSWVNLPGFYQVSYGIGFSANSKGYFLFDKLLREFGYPKYY